MTDKKRLTEDEIETAVDGVTAGHRIAEHELDEETYPDSEVLRNAFDLRDPVAAHTMETRLAFARVTELIQNLADRPADRLDRRQPEHRALQARPAACPRRPASAPPRPGAGS